MTVLTSSPKPSEASPHSPLLKKVAQQRCAVAPNIRITCVMDKADTKTPKELRCRVSLLNRLSLRGIISKELGTLTGETWYFFHPAADGALPSGCYKKTTSLSVSSGCRVHPDKDFVLFRYYKGDLRLTMPGVFDKAIDADGVYGVARVDENSSEDVAEAIQIFYDSNPRLASAVTGSAVF